MAVPTTGSTIAVSDIFLEANPSLLPGAAPSKKVSDLFKKSYFEGPGGNSNISYNGWGQWGVTTGNDAIYTLNTVNTSNKLSDFAGLTYFYDGNTAGGFVVGLQINNVLPPPPPIPPGQSHDYTVVVELWDSTYTYMYLSTGPIMVPQGTTYNPNVISTNLTPIIKRGYWRITFTNNQTVIPTNAAIIVNGSLQGGGLTPGIFQTDVFTGTDGVVYYAGFYSATGLQFDITIN